MYIVVNMYVCGVSSTTKSNNALKSAHSILRLQEQLLEELPLNYIRRQHMCCYPLSFVTSSSSREI